MAQSAPSLLTQGKGQLAQAAENLPQGPADVAAAYLQAERLLAQAKRNVVDDLDPRKAAEARMKLMEARERFDGCAELMAKTLGRAGETLDAHGCRWTRHRDGGVSCHHRLARLRRTAPRLIGWVVGSSSSMR